MLCKYHIKCLAHSSLGHCKSRSGGIGGVTKHCKTALLSYLSHPSKVGRVSEYRCVVHLKVTCMENRTCRRVYCKCRSIRYRVICLYKFNIKITQLYGISVLYHIKLGSIVYLMFFKFLFNKRTGKLCTVDRHIKLL